MSPFAEGRLQIWVCAGDRRQAEVGQYLPLIQYIHPSFERLINSEICRVLCGSTSIFGSFDGVAMSV
jgi:hypothetical protein